MWKPVNSNPKHFDKHNFVIGMLLFGLAKFRVNNVCKFINGNKKFESVIIKENFEREFVFCEKL